MYFDGSKRVEGVGVGVVLISPQGDTMKYILRMSFPNASNNEAEYEALLHGMRMAKACGATHLIFFGDSNLVVQQVMNLSDAFSDNMTVYRDLYYNLEGTFDGCKVSHINRARNEEADNLANIGSECLPIHAGVFWEEISERSIKTSKPLGSKKTKEKPKGGSRAVPAVEDQDEKFEPKDAMMIEVTWMQPYLEYMINKELPKNLVKARRITRRSKAFVVIKGELFKRSISGVLQRCVIPEEGKIILKEIHEGICGHHARSCESQLKLLEKDFIGSQLSKMQKT
jgi:ribonuclease HI